MCDTLDLAAFRVVATKKWRSFLVRYDDPIMHEFNAIIRDEVWSHLSGPFSSFLYMYNNTYPVTMLIRSAGFGENYILLRPPEGNEVDTLKKYYKPKVSPTEK